MLWMKKEALLFKIDSNSINLVGLVVEGSVFVTLLVFALLLELLAQFVLLLFALFELLDKLVPVDEVNNNVVCESVKCDCNSGAHPKAAIVKILLKSKVVGGGDSKDKISNACDDGS